MCHGPTVAALDKEWLLCNGRGGFAFGTTLGVPTRRYHGLLCVAARPPLERWMLLNAILEKVTAGGCVVELANFEFEGRFHPHGYQMLVGFDYDLSPECSWVRFDYRPPGLRVAKWVIVREGRDEVVVRYDVEGPPGRPVRLELLPLASMRDFHAVRREPCRMPLVADDRGFRLAAGSRCPAMRMEAHGVGEGVRDPVRFDAEPHWWYGFLYRVERERGLDFREDLHAPGWFRVEGEGRFTVWLRAGAVVEGAPGDASGEAVDGRVRVPDRAPDLPERLHRAARQFVAQRLMADGSWSRTIIAGYPWFGDWGRDAFISLEGLLLIDGRFDEARAVLCTFAAAQKDGLIPNLFSDYGPGCAYNSVDASLWFIHASDRYVAFSGDQRTWDEVLGPTCERVVDAFLAGTRYDIHVADDGLVWAGREDTQITWMDARYGGTAVTPRHGKAVEVNALWYRALCLLHERTGREKFARLRDRVLESYTRVFWNERCGCLFDCVRGPDDVEEKIRPNQILAVSLAHSPLEPRCRRAVVETVRSHLLTPYGLRTLSPGDPDYHPRYEGGPKQRDHAYHQGTVWSWLMGPYVEAYLRTRHFGEEARAECRRLLVPLIRHLDEAGLGSVSEVFDGDPPHRPGGCPAQAWSVAELRRALRLVEAPTASP